ncbi:MAG TPA: SCO family protein [Streptosporangiaceae bacterium]|nr:SCO family protein [Streptosporangiaceae bacterium]
MRRVGVVAAVVAAVALALVAGCSGSSGAAASGASAGTDAQSAAALANPNLDTGSSLGGAPAPDFRLTDQFGKQVSLSQYRGKVVLLDFNDSECTTICPLTSQAMVWARQLLGSAGSGVALLGIDANPDAIAVSNVLAYSRAHDMVNQWDFLTGTLPQLTSVWKAYKIAVQIQQGQIDHTPALYVIDQRGRLQKVYLTQMAYSSIGQSAEVIAQDVATLLPGHPKVRSTTSLAAIAPRGPATQVTLPAVGGGSMALGPGEPRMMMFVATWLSETSDLRAQLKMVGDYAAYATRHHLPGLTGIDELTTEPSQAAAVSYLAPYARQFPIALDATGQVADGYAVQDQPWFALVNAAGKIVWSHDGWTSLQTLEAAAKRA